MLEEALDTSHPLLERVKFLAIFANNLDEFFMIRVAGLQRQLTDGVIEPPLDGLSPVRQLEEIRAALAPLIESAHRCWHEDLLVRLERRGHRREKGGSSSRRRARRGCAGSSRTRSFRP